MNKIIFVCTGNTCRSPMAEMIMTNLLNTLCSHEIQVCSRGLSVFGQSPVSHHVHNLMIENNIDSSLHRSRLLSLNDLTDKTVILTMTLEHKNLIYSLFPAYSSQTYTLAEYTTGVHFDIQDPYGGSPDVYRQCFMQLESLLKKLLKKTCLDYKKDVY